MPAVSPVEVSSDVESDLASFDDLLLPVRFCIMLEFPLAAQDDYTC